MPFSAQLQVRTALYLLTFLELAPCVALVLTKWASIPSPLRLAIELLHVRLRVSKALRKSKRLEGTTTTLFSLSLLLERKNSLHLPWPVAPRTLFDIICSLDREGEQDFAGPISVRASEVVGPISRHRIADILFHMKLVSRASRRGLIVGILRILCNGRCTAQRFHTEEYEQNVSCWMSE